jgi:hypothetical protein
LGLFLVSPRSVENPWGDDLERQRIAQKLSAYDSPSAIQAQQYSMPLGRGPLPLPDMSQMVTSLDGVALPSPSGYMQGIEYEPPGQSWWQKGLSVLPGVDLKEQYGSFEERDLTPAEKTEMDMQWRTRQDSERPPLGQAGLANLGQNRLRNFGMGQMMREEYQRWR